MIPGECRGPDERAVGAKRRRARGVIVKAPRRGNGRAANRNRVSGAATEPPVSTEGNSVSASGSSLGPGVSTEGNSVSASGEGSGSATSSREEIVKAEEVPPQNLDGGDDESLDAALAPATARERRSAAAARQRRLTQRDAADQAGGQGEDVWMIDVRKMLQALHSDDESVR